MNVTFFGVRGSTPCSCDANQRYGGNTACVAIEAPGHEPIVLDLGTGLRFFGATQPADGSFRGHALVTHLHWDHVQGLPVLRARSTGPARALDIYGPPQDDGRSLEEAFGEFMRPPYFPVRVRATWPATSASTPSTTACTPSATPRSRTALVPHCGPTNGYRVEHGRRHASPTSATTSSPSTAASTSPTACSSCATAPTCSSTTRSTRPTSSRAKAHWGHCTVDYAVHVAREAGVRRLALFHHDPDHDDDMVDRLLDGARAGAAGAASTRSSPRPRASRWRCRRRAAGRATRAGPSSPRAGRRVGPRPTGARRRRSGDARPAGSTTTSPSRHDGGPEGSHA